MADLYKDKQTVHVQVTDYPWVDGNNKQRTGYTMNRILWNNIQGIPKYLEKDNSMVIIISGSGLTRLGKSFFGMQIGYAAAWSLAGGIQDEDGNVIEKAKKEPKVNYYFDTIQLTNDIANDSEDYQVYILDEADEAAGSRTSMSKKNREFRDLIIRSALKKYVLIIILPDFFQLNQHWACVNSDCLLNVYTVGGKRGYFNFYDRNAKERLYFWGKKKVGADRYGTSTSWPTFFGTFPNMFPGDLDKYKNVKQKSLLQLNKNTRRNTSIERDRIIKKAYDITGMTYAELAKEFDMPEVSVSAAIQRDKIRSNELLEGGNSNGSKGTNTSEGEVN